MIPYLPPPAPLSFFGLRLQIAGLCLFLGVVVAHLVLVRRARAVSLGPERAAERFSMLLLLTAVIGAHLAGVIAEEGAAALARPSLFLSSEGALSSAAGGAVAALIGGIYLRARRLDLRAWADVVAYAFPFGWLIARTGCALAHDHLGVRSASWLAVRFPEGSRLDCGLLEWLATPLLVGLAVALGRRPQPAGRIAGVIGIAYAAMRFSLDVVRATDLPQADARLLGLTFAQWLCLPLFAACVHLLWGRSSR